MLAVLSIPQPILMHVWNHCSVETPVMSKFQLATVAVETWTQLSVSTGQ